MFGVARGSVFASSSIEIELSGEGQIKVAADMADITGCIRYIGDSKSDAISGVKNIYYQLAKELDGSDMSINYCDSHTIDQLDYDELYVGKIYYNVNNIGLNDIKSILNICLKYNSDIEGVRLGVKNATDYYAEAISKAIDEAYSKMNKLTSEPFAITEIEEGYSYYDSEYYCYNELDIDNIIDQTINITSSVTVKFVA